MAVPSSLALELKILITHSSVSPQRKTVTTFVSLVFVRPLCSSYMCPSLFISGTQLSFKLQNLRDSCGGDLCCSSQGGSQYASAFCWTCCQEGCHTTTQPFAVYSNAEQKASTYTQCSQLSFLFLYLETLPHSGTTLSSCHPADTETTLSHLGFCPESPSELLCLLSTFKKGTSPPVADY